MLGLTRTPLMRLTPAPPGCRVRFRRHGRLHRDSDRTLPFFCNAAGAAFRACRLAHINQYGQVAISVDVLKTRGTRPQARGYGEVLFSSRGLVGAEEAWGERRVIACCRIVPLARENGAHASSKGGKTGRTGSAPIRFGMSSHRAGSPP